MCLSNLIFFPVFIVPFTWRSFSPNKASAPISASFRFQFIFPWWHCFFYREAKKIYFAYIHFNVPKNKPPKNSHIDFYITRKLLNNSPIIKKYLSPFYWALFYIFSAFILFEFDISHIDVPFFDFILNAGMIAYMGIVFVSLFMLDIMRLAFKHNI